MPQTPFPPANESSPLVPSPDDPFPSLRQRISTPLASPPSEPLSSSSKGSHRGDVPRAGEKKEKGVHHPLLDFDQLEPWMSEFESEYTLTGYRREQNSYAGCAWSIIGYLHNETINIHTHLLGSLTPLILLLTHHLPPSLDLLPLLQPSYPSLTYMDTLHLSIFLASAFTCLAFSATYHTLSCHSKRVANSWNQMDYVGIVALIVGSNYPALYYGFYCSPARQITYTALITLLGLLTTFTVLSPTYCTSAYRWARTSLFLLLGLSAVLPVSHVVYSYGFNRARSEIGLGYLLESGGLYVVGALTYAVRFPERRWPRTFDLVGSSHQIFHCCVIAAAYLHLKCIQTAMAYHHGIMHGTCLGDEI